MHVFNIFNKLPHTVLVKHGIKIDGVEMGFNICNINWLLQSIMIKNMDGFINSLLDGCKRI
jgi:hypothetical protein